MKKLNLKITNNTNLDAYFLINGKKPKFKKNQYGNYISVIETESDQVEIKIYEWNEYKSGLWLITSVIYFIVSIFGILDIKQDKRFRSIDCNFKIKLEDEENNLKLTYNAFKDNDIAIVHEGDCEVEVLNNKYYIDEQSKKRYKTVRLIKLFVMILAVIAILLFLK